MFVTQQTSISLVIPGRFGPKKEIYSNCYEIGHSEQVKFVNHKYYMAATFRSSYSPAFYRVAILINFTSYKNVTESLFKIKVFKSLKEVMDPFLNVKNLESPKKVMESFFSTKNSKTEMVSFFRIKDF